MVNVSADNNIDPGDQEEQKKEDVSQKFETIQDLLDI